MKLNSYTRVVNTSDGGSAFEDAELRLDEQPGMLVGDLGAQSAAFVRFASADSFAEDHPAAWAQWVIVLRGAIEVQVTGGTSRQFRPGDLLLDRRRGRSWHLRS
jgi:quercetin dioxygenase-like cupin family protein